MTCEVRGLHLSARQWPRGPRVVMSSGSGRIRVVFVCVGPFRNQGPEVDAGRQPPHLLPQFCPRGITCCPLLVNTMSIMSDPARNQNSYRGRFQVPTSNLTTEEDDYPEFEPFDEGAEATPRTTPGAGSLSVQQVDMCLQMNKQTHYTSAYDINHLVVRRGLQFVIKVTFNQAPAGGEDFQLNFLIGSSPSASKGSEVVVTFGSRQGGLWSGQILESLDQTVTLGVTPSPDAIVGKYRTFVSIAASGGMQRTKRDPSTDLYLLFNAWCPEDPVYLPDESEKHEYVLNDNGVIFQGSVGSMSTRNWMYGQFEKGILDACIHILDASRMPIHDRGNIIKVVRKGSAMLNSQDDNGVMVGNWSDDFSMGKPPTSWTGSVQILLQYVNTGVPVCYAQCWVFAGVFNTFLRCLGIPARVITNFSSAHDNTGNLKTDLIFKPDGSPDKRHTRDSIWNYHCWNEAFMVRPDLPNGFGGWQVVDATPQETSDGHFRCGPASVAAIKEGVLCHPFDLGFVFAEVNSDVVFSKRDRFGTLTPFRVDKTHIGQAIYTKAVSGSSPMDVTHTYKYPEGSSEDERTMARAEEYGCSRDHSELPDPQLTVNISVGQLPCLLGHDVNLMVEFHNSSEFPRTIHAHMSASVIFYTGVTASQFKDQDFKALVQPYQSERPPPDITSQEYTPHLGAQRCLHCIVTGQADDQSVSAIKVIDLQPPGLNVTLSGQPQVGQQMFVTVTFTNLLSITLYNVYVALEGAGLISHRHRLYSSIEPQASITWTESFIPRLHGARAVLALLDCSNLSQVWGVGEGVISP
ncbi:coagulation factor XIII A chain-like [Echeneis naucrates]|uniref:coagulation factor XIII A chain-like n=1 Tax=Echeneis naucrates TaxID=173247 RepID=UPI001113A6A6|nr:coagulation factor XIII A chain [Echeneis naucrates]